ncbi:hypothetical protein GCM10027175_35320 [Hymenobacter latericoloratus]
MEIVRFVLNNYLSDKYKSDFPKAGKSLSRIKTRMGAARRVLLALGGSGVLSRDGRRNPGSILRAAVGRALGLFVAGAETKANQANKE